MEKMHRLLEESKAVKVQADRILNESRIIEILKTYGEVKIGGSYTLDVMLRPDIDLFVIAPQHDWSKILSIQTVIMETKYFGELDFANWVDFTDLTVTSLKGYYFQPRVQIDSELWKLDVWFLTPEYDRSAETTEHFEKLLAVSGESEKISILEIKEAMRQGRKYIDGVNGKLIYKAVLEHNVKTVDEFKIFLATYDNL
jgi:hypothetical protein